MTALFLSLAALAGLCWLSLSPFRLAGAGVALLITHPVPTFALTVVVAVALTVAAARMAYRSLREDGWCLVTVQRPALSVSCAGGVAS
ncbi:hypothetical protein [Actinomadura madurae]|uniref:hypothetical protein n=1 Tax=Actinomadura madurae TaxID=1993 RepID=UPI000D969310|nr:hypothetical protein [Actinomadura madurae]SPT59251.1 Uncharacterised protein [Actinomadura madurae]